VPRRSRRSLWLLGKTGAGKTAIVTALTGDPYAEVAEGFEPCTRTAAYYDVPPEAPLLRFLDTRGLGEVDYDPTKDIAWCERQSHLVLVVMQVADPVQDKLVRVLGQARRRHRDWPVVVAQTGLHRLCPAGAKHPEPYPCTGGPDDESHATLPHALRQALAHQRRLFDGVPGLDCRHSHPDCRATHVVANAGAVGRGIIVAEDFDRRCSAHRSEQDQRNEVGLGHRQFAEFAVRIGAGGVEVPERDVPRPRHP